MFFSPSTPGFPCQYHSTKAPYPSIQLQPKLYNVFIPAVQFSPVTTIPPLLHTHPSNYNTRCIKFSPSTSVFPVSIIPPLLHTHPSNYHPCCKMFSPSTSVFPCQYHSTIAPYSFIHLPPTLYNVFSQHFSFPLSVSFHHCSIPIHPTTTHAVKCFLPALQFSLSVSFHHCSIPIHPTITHAV